MKRLRAAGSALVAALAVAAVGSGSARGASAPKWTRLEAPQMVVYSALPPDATQTWAVQFQQFHRGLSHFLHLDERALRPVTVVLFRSDAEFQPYKPIENGRPAALSGYFTRSELGNFIAVAGHSNNDLHHVIFHEATHWLTNVSEVPIPLWLDEGLAEVFSTFRVQDRTCTFGDLLPWHMALLRHSPLMPLKDLMRVRRGELQFNERQRTGLFYAESWVFTHYLLFSAQAGGFRQYNELIRQLRPETDPDTVFRAVFGTDCFGMQARLRQYLFTGQYHRYTLPFDREAVEADFRVTPAPPAEVELAQSCLLEGAGQPVAALPRLARVVSVLGERPAPWEAQGFAYYELQDFGETERSFRQAAAQGSRNYFVYSFLGDSELGVHPGQQVQIAGNRGPSVQALRAAIDDYERELELNPREPHAYDNLATSLYLLTPIRPADLGWIARGARLYPTDPALQAGLGVAALKSGRGAEGLARLRAVADDPRPPAALAAQFARSVLAAEAMRATLEAIQSRWEARDFAGVQAAIDSALPHAANAVQRRELVATRARAGVLILCSQAVEALNGGNREEARRLLRQADGDPAADGAIRQQIQKLLSRL